MIIAICEDSPIEMIYLRDHLRFYLDQGDIAAEIITFSSGEEFISYLEQNNPPHICFLDIYMKGITGVQAAECIREKSGDTAIVFTTSSLEHMASGWRMAAAHYLVKPFSKADIDEAIFRCLKQVAYQKRYVEVISNRVKRKIPLEQILYVESQNKYCVIFLLSGESVKTLMRLDDMEKMLADQRFLRCHQSFLVNMDKIEGVSAAGFVLVDSLCLPIRRGSRSDLVARYEDYYIEKTRRMM